MQDRNQLQARFWKQSIDTCMPKRYFGAHKYLDNAKVLFMFRFKKIIIIIESVCAET